MNAILKHLTLHFEIDATRGYLATLYPGTDRKGNPEPRIDWMPTGLGHPDARVVEREIGQFNTLLQAFIRGAFSELKRMDDAVAIPEKPITGLENSGLKVVKLGRSVDLPDPDAP